MGLDLEFITHDTFLEIVVTGEYDMQSTIDKFSHILGACRMTKLSKVIINFQKLAGIPSATEKIIYAFGIKDMYKDHLLDNGQELMVAYVGRTLQVNTYKPELQIIKENNMQFNIFDNLLEAYEWLGVNPT